MPLPIHRTESAKKDLIDIWRQIAADDEATAGNVLRFIDSRCRKLAEFPRIGHPREDLAQGLRCLVVGKRGWQTQFLVFYRISKTAVEIVRILDGHRNITPIMVSP